MTERRRVLLPRDRVLLENLADTVEVGRRKLNVLGCPILVEVLDGLGLHEFPAISRRERDRDHLRSGLPRE